MEVLGEPIRLSAKPIENHQVQITAFDIWRLLDAIQAL